MPSRLTVAVLMLDIEMEWTLNASLTRLSSYRKCSKHRTLGHSAQATSLLPIAGTTRCSRIAHVSAVAAVWRVLPNRVPSASTRGKRELTGISIIERRGVMQGTQFRYVIKFVADMDKAVKFYRDVLGLQT